MSCEFDLSDVRAEQGLPEELFLAVSSLMPVPNVDLFILDSQGRILLSWRSDVYFGTGWHLPGGCIRFKETMLERVERTAQKELGCSVRVDDAPIAIRDVIIRQERPGLDNQNHRAHHLAVLYRCYLPDDFEVREGTGADGDLKWFAHLPENMLSVHDAYRDVFEKYGLI